MVIVKNIMVTMEFSSVTNILAAAALTWTTGVVGTTSSYFRTLSLGSRCSLWRRWVLHAMPREGCHCLAWFA